MIFVVGLILVGVLGIGLIPILLQETVRDWVAYEQAADRLRGGVPLYVFHLATPVDQYYLYPPAGAAVWALAGSPFSLAMLKILALGLVGTLALLVVDRSRPWWERVGVTAGFIAVAAIAPPDVHDLILGNVMVLYVGTISASVAVRGWRGAVPLGILLAIAAKPLVAPYLVWMVLRRRRDFGKVLATALAVSLATAFLIGFGRYEEYVRAIPQMGVIADSDWGVGLGRVSTTAAIAGIVAAFAMTFVASRRLDVERSAAVAIVAGLIAQPTIGFNYFGLLIPAVVVLWARDRIAGAIAVVAVPLLTVSVPLGAVVAVAVLAFLRLERLVDVSSSPRPLARVRDVPNP
jgi:hypothetical protein